MGDAAQGRRREALRTKEACNPVPQGCNRLTSALAPHAGDTPFCRNADGRAVLRSSVREYLASEAMHHMGVPSTRALSLIASRSDTVLRPWYAPSTYAANANTTAPHSNTCADTDAQCAAWAMLGECGRNVAFMRDKCAKSCELCGVWRDVQPQRHGGDHHRPAIPTMAIPTMAIPTMAIPTMAIPTMAIPTMAIPTMAIPTTCCTRTAATTTGPSGVPSRRASPLPS